MCPRSKNHPPSTHSLVYKTNITFIISTIIDLRFFAINHTAFPQRPINSLLPPITFLCVCHFFSLFLSFLLHTFLWACRSLCEPQKFFSNSIFVHSFVCAIPHLFLNGFQPNFYQHFSHVCMPYLSYYFQPVKTLEFICDRLLHCRLTVTITWTPSI